MAKRKLMTIDDLVKFCREQNFTKFSSKESGYKLAVQVPTTFEIEENVDDDHRGMLKLKFRIFHTGLNRNGSFVSEKAAKDAMPTIKNRPILAAIHQLDNGEWDFEAHNFEVVKNEETGEDEIIYIEKQVGSFDESEPFFEYDEELDKTYVCSYGYIPEEYSKAAEIIRRKNGTKNSCELSIDELSFDVKESCLSLDKFYVAASTLLGSKKDGTEIGEGMLGSRADIADFSEHNNSMFSKNEELLIEIKKLNENLSRFTIESNKEGGKTLVKFEELLKKYNKTIEEITFEYENLTDEELEQKFEEVFGEDTEGEGADPEPASEGDEAKNETDEDVNIKNEEEEKSGNDESQKDEDPEESKDSEDEEEIVNEPIAFSVGNKTFAVSLDDMQFAMNALVNETYSEQDGCYYSTIVYEDHVVMVDCFSYGKAYRQKYAKRKKRCSLIGERVPVKSYWVTEEEESMIDNMRANYSTIEEQLKEYQLKEENAQKDALFVSEDYSSISNKEEFKALAENHSEFSVDELKAKLDEVLLSYAKKNALEFSVKVPEKKKVNRVSFGMNTEESNTENEFKPYGDLFD